MEKDKADVDKCRERFAALQQQQEDSHRQIADCRRELHSARRRLQEILRGRRLVHQEMGQILRETGLRVSELLPGAADRRRGREQKKKDS